MKMKSVVEKKMSKKTMSYLIFLNDDLKNIKLSLSQLYKRIDNVKDEGFEQFMEDKKDEIKKLKGTIDTFTKKIIDWVEG